MYVNILVLKIKVDGDMIIYFFDKMLFIFFYLVVMVVGLFEEFEIKGMLIFGCVLIL